MSSRFLVDVVATPHLDLNGAMARDMAYREQNGRFPMSARSEMSREQEKLNKFLQYVNESFIIKGFSKTASVSATVKGISNVNKVALSIGQAETVLGSFPIAHGDGAQLQVQFSLTGEMTASGTDAAVLSVKIRENGSEMAVLKQEAAGTFLLGAPYLLANRAEGTDTVEIVAVAANGQAAIPVGGAAASVVCIE